MADEKSIVKTNKMIHKKTGASFLVVFVIYVSLVYTDSKKNCVMFTPSTHHLCNFWKAIKMPTCTHTVQGDLYLFHYVLDNLNWLLFVVLSNLIINLMYNIKKLYFNDQHKFRV